MSIHGDKTLEALDLAAEYWLKAAYSSKDERIGMAAKLHRFKHFSTPQLAKIVRINARYLYDEFGKSEGHGGRFDPATLSSLSKVRMAHLTQSRVPTRLLAVVVKGGTSFSCAARLAGIPYSTYYNEMNGLAKAEAEKNPKYMPKVTPELKEEIFKLKRRGVFYHEIAPLVGVSRSTVIRVIKEGE